MPHPSLCLQVYTKFSPGESVSSCGCLSFVCPVPAFLRTPVLGFGSTLLWYDLILTKYLSKFIQIYILCIIIQIMSFHISTPSSPPQRGLPWQRLLKIDRSPLLLGALALIHFLDSISPALELPDIWMFVPHFSLILRTKKSLHESSDSVDLGHRTSLAPVRE